MRKKYLLANWKMLGNTRKITALLEQLVLSMPGAEPALEIVLFPPTPYLSLVADVIGSTSIALGAQTVSEFAPGAYTGEVAAEMLLDLGCRYVLVGHSERRSYFGENDAKIASKFSRAMELGLVPVICIGETLEQWQANKTFMVLEQQLTELFAEKKGAQAFIIAYEPVWAIGTGKVAHAEQVQHVHQFIRTVLVTLLGSDAKWTPIVYGGSVKAQNFAALLAMPDVDGGLVGGASWDAIEFSTMAKMYLI